MATKAFRKCDSRQKMKLIAEVQKRPPLWDKTASREQGLINGLWDEVGATVDMTRDDARKKWKNMVDQFRVHLKNVFHGKPLSAGLDDVRDRMQSVHWPYFRPLLFLHSVLRSRGTAIVSGEAAEQLLQLRVKTQAADMDFEESNSTFNNITSPTSSIGLSDSSSDELPKLVPPSVGNMRKRKRVATADNDSIGPYVLKKLKKIETQISVPSSDPVLNFGTFVGDLFRQVPDQLKRHCQRMITNILFDYADGRVPTVVVHAD